MPSARRRKAMQIKGYAGPDFETLKKREKNRKKERLVTI